MAKTRIYTVAHDDTGNAYLVRATSQAQALSHVARCQYSTRVATQDDIVAAMQSGIAVEDATQDTQPIPEGESA